MRLEPSLGQVRTLAGPGRLVPVYAELLADLETPVSAYLKLAAGEPYAFLLESVEGGERLGRFSFIGTGPRQVLTVRGEDPLPCLAALVGRREVMRLPGLPRFVGGAIGYLAYDVVRFFEPRVALPEADPLGLPDAVFMLADTLLVFDHLRHRMLALSLAAGDGDIRAEYLKAGERVEAMVARLERPAGRTAALRLSGRGEVGEVPVASNLTREGFIRIVERTLEYIRAGDIIQAVLSQRFSRPTAAGPLAIYRALRHINPSPYMFLLTLGDFHLVGASPEMLVRVEDGLIEVHPIAGTRPRGANPAEDAALEAELRSDEKERAEHIMLVDLARNDLGRVSVPGSVKVCRLMEVERYSHVMHLVSHVTGQLRPDRTCFDALRSCFPAGTLSGAPKVRAMEIISELEPERRGPYGGAVGYVGFNGNLDTAITIRTVILKDGVGYVQAGAGIVADSRPEAEYQETVNKAQALLRAMDLAEELTALGAEVDR